MHLIVNKLKLAPSDWSSGVANKEISLVQLGNVVIKYYGVAMNCFTFLVKSVNHLKLYQLTVYKWYCLGVNGS